MARLVSKDCVIDVELRDEIVTLGRSSANAICLRAPGISKVHAKIEPDGPNFRISDLQSTNGTLVNGKPVEACTLRDLDVIKLGAEVLLFLADGKGVAPDEVLRVFMARENEIEGGGFPGGAESLEAAGAVAAIAEEESREPAEYAEALWEPPWKAARRPRAEGEPSDQEEEIEMQLAEGEVAYVGDLDRGEDVRGEFLRLEQQLRFRRFFVAALLIMASALVHVQIMLVLGNWVLYSGGGPARKVVVFKTEVLEPLEREAVKPLPPPPSEMPLVTATPPKEAAEEKIIEASKDMPVMGLPDVKPIEIESLTGPPRPAVAAVGASVVGAAPGTGKVLSLITAEKPETQEEIMDDLAREMVEALRKDFLHVILMFDESHSIDKDRQWMRNRLEALLKEVYLHIKAREVERLRWSVASFGKIVHLQQSPTNKVEDARKAIGRVPNDESGMENPCAALQFCMKNLRTRFKTFVIVVTDERGDDTMNDQMLENTVEMLKRMQVRVFVFGREANFSTPVIKEPYRDPKSGQTVQVETDVGPETAESEFFTPDELFFRSDVMPAGFGMWGLARICSESKGRYYFLNPGPQVYDSVRLEACAPDLISRKQYEERRERVVPRRKILAVVQEWDKVRPESRVQSQNVMTMVPFYMNKIDKANAFCTEGITALKGLQFTGLDPKYMPTRWTAHRDLAVAELYKFKYLLEEYKEGFKGLRGAPLSRNGGPLQGFFATLVPRQGGGTTPVSKKLYESATAQFSMVMEKYAKTPWGAIAANELKTMGIITVQPQYAAPAEERREERERQPPRKPPEPPKV